jgi:redox-regulated HSP33 family molecular chaperone
VRAQLVVSVQSWEGLGTNEDERMRLRNALAGGALVQRMPTPEKFLEAAGTDRETEHSAQIDSAGSTALGSVRSAHHMKVSPNDVRSAVVGEAWLIYQGKCLRMQVLPNPGSV